MVSQPCLHSFNSFTVSKEYGLPHSLKLSISTSWSVQPSHQRNEHQNYFQIPSHSIQNAYHQEKKTTNAWEHVEKRSTYSLLVGGKPITAIMEIWYVRYTAGEMSLECSLFQSFNVKWLTRVASQEATQPCFREKCLYLGGNSTRWHSSFRGHTLARPSNSKALQC